MKPAVKSLVFFLFLLGSFAESFADDSHGHWEFWNSDSVEARLGKSLRARFGQEFRYHTGVHYYTHTDLVMIFDRNPNFEWETGYRQVLSKADNRWGQEDRLFLRAIPQWKWGRLELADTNTVEYRSFDDGHKLWRYRNKLAISVPARIGNFRFNPYVADEIFIYLTGKDRMDFYRNQFYVGAKSSLGRNVELDLYYMGQSKEKELDEGEIWRNFNVMGVKLRISF
jgi:hypothetical protein